MHFMLQHAGSSESRLAIANLVRAPATPANRTIICGRISCKSNQSGAGEQSNEDKNAKAPYSALHYQPPVLVVLKTAKMQKWSETTSHQA